MYITNLQKTEALDATPEYQKGKANNTIQWLLGVPEGAPNFEMRYISLSVEGTTLDHGHPWEHEVFVVKGTGKIKLENGEFLLEPNTAVFVPANEQHQFINISPKENFEFICVVPKGTRPVPEDCAAEPQGKPGGC